MLGSLLLGQSVSEGSGEFGSEELSSSWGILVKVSGQSSSLLLVQNGQVSGNVLSDGSNFGQLSSATRWGLGISQISQLFLEFFDVSSNSLSIRFSDFLVDSLLDHLSPIIFMNYKWKKNEFFIIFSSITKSFPNHNSYCSALFSSNSLTIFKSSWMAPCGLRPFGHVTVHIPMFWHSSSLISLERC